MAIPLAGAILGSAAIGGISALIGGERQNASAQEAAREAAEINQQQYATRYQTQVKDMRAAGLNPILAATQGAPVPSAAPAAAVPANSVKDAGTSALSSARLAAEIKLLDQQADKSKAETEGVIYDNAQRAFRNRLYGLASDFYDWGASSAGSIKRSFDTIMSRSRSPSNPMSYKSGKKPSITFTDAYGVKH